MGLRPDVPYPILAALTDPYYQEGLKDHFDTLPKKYKNRNLSVTTLARSPRQQQLSVRHSHEVIQDPVESGYWKMFGHVVHSILEDHPKENDIIEMRQGIDVDGYWIHGQADRLTWDDENGFYILQDWKLSSSEALLYGAKPEYVSQLNVLKFIFENDNLPIGRLQNVWLSRNWDKRKAMSSPRYPQSPIVVIDIPIHDDRSTLQYIRDRIIAHDSARNLADDDLPDCTDQERWVSDVQYKVIKKDPKTGEAQKKAKYVAGTMGEAGDAIERLINEEFTKWSEKNLKLKKPKPMSEFPRPVFDVQEKKPEPVKCAWCDIRSFCSQRQAELELNPQSTEAEEEDEDGIPT